MILAPGQQTVPYDDHPYPNRLYAKGHGYFRDGFEETMKEIKPSTLRTRLPLCWSVEIGGIKYSEKWLRAYAAFRHVYFCTALASLYADEKTNTKLPIVCGMALDMELLMAHARMIIEVGGKVNTDKILL